MIKIQWLSPIWSQKHQNNAKLQKWSKYNDLHRYDVKSDQITMICTDLTSKRSKMLSYVANHSKQRKTTKVIKIQWLASIWCQKWSNYDEFAPIWRQNDLKCWGSRKTFKTTQNYKSDQITWIASIWIQNDQNNAKLQKRSNYDEFAPIWRQNELKCRGTSQNIQNNAKLQK